MAAPRFPFVDDLPSILRPDWRRLAVQFKIQMRRGVDRGRRLFRPVSRVRGAAVGRIDHQAVGGIMRPPRHAVQPLVAGRQFSKAGEADTEQRFGDPGPIDAMAVFLIVQLDGIGPQRRHGMGGRYSPARAAPMTGVPLHPVSIAGKG
jgi:hypothetical protein